MSSTSCVKLLALRRPRRRWSRARKPLGMQAVRESPVSFDSSRATFLDSGLLRPSCMRSVVVVGAQWGDEGKGKVVDYLAGSFDYIARVAGGHNAGHTVIIGKDRYVLQLIPCGILRPKQHAVIGTGTVVDPAALVAE